MQTHSSFWATPQGTMFRRPVTVALVLFGPAVTVAFLLRWVGSSWLSAPELPVVLVVALAFWSPLFLSVPALLLQDARDAALDHWRGPVLSLARGVVLVPYLLFAPSSPARLEVAASLAGFATALALALPHLMR